MNGTPDASAAPGDATNGRDGSCPALRASGLRKVYRASRRRPPRAALEELTLSVREGAWVALLGPNGSGKSTLVRLLSTMERPDAGTLEGLGCVLAGDGARAQNLREYRASLGVVFQSPGLDRLLTVRENLITQAALHGLSSEAARDRIADAAARFDLSDRLDDRVGTLSGGLIRRADLARAVLHRPRLLVLDEATAGLDHEARGRFLETVATLRREAGGEGRPLTVLMTTHLMDEADRADRVVMLHAGRIVADGTPSSLRDSLGGRVVRSAGDHAASVLERCGLATERSEDGRVIGRTDDPEALARGAAELSRSGAAFEVSPPTLGDAYLAVTGRSLAVEAEP